MTTCFVSLLVSLVLLLAPPASASTVNVQFHGTIDTVLHPELLDGSEIAVGSLFIGDVTVFGDGAGFVPADVLYPGSPAFFVQGSSGLPLVDVFAEVGFRTETHLIFRTISRTTM